MAVVARVWVRVCDRNIPSAGHGDYWSQVCCVDDVYNVE